MYRYLRRWVGPLKWVEPLKWDTAERVSRIGDDARAFMLLMPPKFVFNPIN
jgi:hypothetical protein